MYFLKFLEAGKFEIKVRQGRLLVKCRLICLLMVSSSGREKGTCLLHGVSNPSVPPWGPPSLPDYLPKASPANTITWWGKRQLKFQHMNLEWRTAGLPGGSDGKESAYHSGDLGSISRTGRSPGGGSGYPLQYSCLENPMDREAWWATVHGVAKSRTHLGDWHTQKHHYLFLMWSSTLPLNMKLLDSSHKMQEAHVKRDDSWVREALACPANPGQSSTAHVGCQPSLSAHQPCTSGAELRLNQKR